MRPIDIRIDIPERDVYLQVQPAPVTVLVGPNESGKTTALGAIEAALHGPTGSTWPVLGTIDDHLTIAVEFESADGSRVRLQRGARRGKHQVQFQGSRKVRQVASEIAATFGRGAVWRPVDLQGMTRAQRLAWFQANMAGGLVDLDLGELEEHLGELDVEVPTWTRPVEQLTAMADQLREERLQIDRDRKSAKATVDRLSADPPPASSGSTAMHEARLEELRQEGERLASELGRAEGLQSSRAQIASVIARLEQELGEDRNNPNGHPIRTDDAKTGALARVEQLSGLLTTIVEQKERAKRVIGRLDEEIRHGEDADDGEPVRLLREALDLCDADGRVASLIRLAIEELAPDLEQLRAMRDRTAANLAELEAKHSAAFDARHRYLLGIQQYDRIRQIEKRLQELVAERDAIELIPVEAIKTSREALRVEYAEVRSELKVCQASDRHRVMLRTARSELRKLTTRRVQVTEAERVVREALVEALEQQTRPLRDPMSRICRAVLGADVRVRLDDGLDLELVREMEQVMHIDEAPASARATAYAALQVAVRESLGGMRYVLLDDLEHLDQDRRTRFVKAMVAEVDGGHLDWCLLAGVDDGWRPPGVTLIEMEA